MTTIKAQLSSFELETRYEAAADPVGKSQDLAPGEYFLAREIAGCASVRSPSMAASATLASHGEVQVKGVVSG